MNDTLTFAYNVTLGTSYFICIILLLLCSEHGPLTRYVKLRVAHAPGKPGTFSPPLRVGNPDMHHCMCVTRSLTSGCLWIWWRGRNPQFYVSGKRPIAYDKRGVVDHIIFFVDSCPFLDSRDDSTPFFCTYNILILHKLHLVLTRAKTGLLED